MPKHSQHGGKEGGMGLEEWAAAGEVSPLWAVLEKWALKTISNDDNSVETLMEDLKHTENMVLVNSPPRSQPLPGSSLHLYASASAAGTQRVGPLL